MSDEAARMIERLRASIYELDNMPSRFDARTLRLESAAYHMAEAADLIASQQAEIARLRDEAERQAWNEADHYNGPDRETKP